MTYLLDFDRTLFDTDAYKAYLAEQPAYREFLALPELELAAILDRDAAAGKLAYAPGELAPFLYPDALAFLNARPDARIVTFGNPHLQRSKVESALHALSLSEVHYTGDLRKGPYLLANFASQDGLVLVDDALAELESVAASCPAMRAIEMRRDGGEGDGRWPVVRSLAELP